MTFFKRFIVVVLLVVIVAFILSTATFTKSGNHSLVCHNFRYEQMDMGLWRMVCTSWTLKFDGKVTQCEECGEVFNLTFSSMLKEPDTTVSEKR